MYVEKYLRIYPDTRTKNKNYLGARVKYFVRASLIGKMVSHNH